MHVVVLFESLFGNTREVAEAIADGARAADPTAEVACLRVAEADLEEVRTADLLVVGGPTHIRGMTSGMSRKMGLAAEEKKESSPSRRALASRAPKCHCARLNPTGHGSGGSTWSSRSPADRSARAAAIRDPPTVVRRA